MTSAVTVRRPTAADAALAVAAAGAVVAESRLWAWTAGEPWQPGGVPAVLVLILSVVAAAVLARRAVPSLAPLGPAAAMVWLGTVQPDQAVPFMFSVAAATAVLAYLAGATGPAATRSGAGPPVRAVCLWGLAGLTAGAVLLALLVGNPDGAVFAPVVVAIFGVLPWVVGRYRRQQRELVRAGAERIAQLEREQHMVAEQARLRERAALAEEMHDSLGHELSLIALRAGALELAPELPDTQRAAAGQLRSACGAATARLAEIVSVLRDGPAPRRPAGESLSRLAERARSSGMAVSLHGQPPAELAATVHRMVQEALTNAAKHAPGAPVTVTVDGNGNGIVVTVANPAPAGPPVPGSAPADRPGAGHGLAALRERARLLGGEVTVSRPGGGFVLAIRLPQRAPQAGEAR